MPSAAPLWRNLSVLWANERNRDSDHPKRRRGAYRTYNLHFPAGAGLEKRKDNMRYGVIGKRRGTRVGRVFDAKHSRARAKAGRRTMGCDRFVECGSLLPLSKAAASRRAPKRASAPDSPVPLFTRNVTPKHALYHTLTGDRAIMPQKQKTPKTLAFLRSFHCKNLVGDSGLEPPTPCMSSKCSNQLS